MTFLEFFEALVSCAPLSIRLSSDRDSILTRPSTVMSIRPLSEPINMDTQLPSDISMSNIHKMSETISNQDIQASAVGQNESIVPPDENKGSVKTSEVSEANKVTDTALPTPVQSSDSRADFVDGKSPVRLNQITRENSIVVSSTKKFCRGDYCSQY